MHFLSIGHPNFPYANILFKQATNSILSLFQEEYHPFIHDTLKKKTQLVYLYFVYRPKKNTPRTDITNDDEKAYIFAPAYGDESTGYHCHMISDVVFSTQIHLNVCLWIMQLQR